MQNYRAIARRPLTLLRMKLGRPEFVPMHDGGKVNSVIDGRQCDSFVVDRHSRNARSKQNFRPRRLQAADRLDSSALIPAHVRHMNSFRDSPNAARKQIQSLMKSELIASKTEDAYPGRFRASEFRCELYSQTVQSGRDSVRLAIASRNAPTPGRMSFVALRTLSDLKSLHVVPETSQRVLDAAQVVQFVINDGDHICSLVGERDARLPSQDRGQRDRRPEGWYEVIFRSSPGADPRTRPPLCTYSTPSSTEYRDIRDTRVAA